MLIKVCQIVEQSPGDARALERILKLIGKSVEFSQATLHLLDKRVNQMQEVASSGKVGVRDRYINLRE